MTGLTGRDNFTSPFIRREICPLIEFAGSLFGKQVGVQSLRLLLSPVVATFLGFYHLSAPLFISLCFLPLARLLSTSQTHFTLHTHWYCPIETQQNNLLLFILSKWIRHPMRGRQEAGGILWWKKLLKSTSTIPAPVRTWNNLELNGVLNGKSSVFLPQP